MQSLSPQDVIRVARSYLGTRWVHQGRSRKGVDCVGLLVVTARELGIPHRDVTNYDRRPSNGQLEKLLSEQLDRIDAREMKLGDIVAIEDQGWRAISHVGILGDGARPFSLIHSWLRRPEPDFGRGVVEMRLSQDWAGLIRAAFRFPGVLVE